jgi:hypothetical protein
MDNFPHVFKAVIKQLFAILYDYLKETTISRYNNNNTDVKRTLLLRVNKLLQPSENKQLKNTSGHKKDVVSK